MEGAAERFFSPPPGDIGVMAGEEHFRHMPAPVFHGTGVLGVLEDGLVEGVAGGAPCVAQDAGHHAGHRVSDDHGAQLAAGQDVVANGDEFVCQMFFHPVVYPFIVPADEHQMVIVPVELFRLVLGEGLSCRGKENHPAPGRFLREHRLARLEEGAAHHEHARAAAADGIVHLVVLIVGKIPGIGHAHFKESPFESALDHALVEEGFNEFWKEGENVNFHVSPPIQAGAPSCVPPLDRQRERMRESPGCTVLFPSQDR